MTMNREVVVALGNLALDLVSIRPVAEDFGLRVEAVPDLKHLRSLAADTRVVAVLVDARALGMSWNDALDAVLSVTPRALPVVCHRFSEDIPWPELAEAGAFHALPVPFDPAEVRQSFGFVSAAAQNKHSEKPLSMRQVA